jgi:dTDP-4-amino-4,6-dideoxygalactose transaminase
VAERTQTPTEIPFVDLARAHAPLRDEILADIGALIDRSEFAIGRAVHAFEREFGAYCGVRDCVGVASGLDAVRFALTAAGVEPGDRVLVPANTFIASFAAISQAGGVPVPVDASLLDYNVDVDAAADAVDADTTFLLPVHLYGQLADMRPLDELARRNGITIVEDAAQAHGASRDGVTPGALSAAAAFSFYPGKNLGAMGDAGAVATNDEQLAARVRRLREHGQREKYVHEVIGWTGRLDAFQAAVLLRKLRYLDEWNEQRRAVAEAYRELLAGVGDLTLPPVADGSQPVWHVYVVRTADPDALATHLRSRGIQTARHYPQPPHLSAAYEHLGYRAGAFPVAELLARELLSLPMFPGMTESEVEAVTDAVSDYFAGR